MAEEPNQPDQLPEADEALLNWVNGKQITPRQLWLIVVAGYLELSPKAITLLAQHQGSIRLLNPQLEQGAPWEN